MPPVRAARPDDAAAIAQLSIELGYPDNDATRMRERLGDLLQRQDHVVLVAEVDGVIAGWGHARINRQVQTADFAELVGLVVSEKIRGKGVGAALLAAVEDWARKQGQALLRLRSNTVRERAHHFYLREGYTELKLSKAFLKKL